MNSAQFRARYGPWAVVTGASEGIGHAFAEQLASLGLNLVLVARRAAELRDFAKLLTKNHAVAVRAIATDLSVIEGLAELEERTTDLDVGLVVAAAGYGTSGSFLDSDLERERNMLELNCFAVMRQCRVFGARFEKRGRGGVILLSSLVGWQGVPRAATYAATKAYIQSLAEALTVELKPKGIDVLASAPGPVDSGFGARAGMRMGAAASPDTVARASIKALGRSGSVVPGALSKLLTYSLFPLPRRLRTLILARIMAGMTQHVN